MTPLFSDDFPDIRSVPDPRGELAKLKAQYAKLGYDDYYVVSGCIPERKAIFEELWKEFEPIADRHFLNQLKRDFHARTWEMYLGVLFKRNGLNVASNDHGPDFVIASKPKIWIEAVTVKQGVGIDAVPELQLNKVGDLPEDQVLLRMAQAFKEKSIKHQQYLRDHTVANGEPYCIAMNTGLLGYPDLEIPGILKLLYGLGHLTLSIPLGGGKPDEPRFSSRPALSKASGKSVSMGLYYQGVNSNISAVIYSNMTVLNHPLEIGADCIVIPNPIAKNPLPKETFPFLVHWIAEDGQLKRIEREGF